MSLCAHLGTRTHTYTTVSSIASESQLREEGRAAERAGDYLKRFDRSGDGRSISTPGKCDMRRKLIEHIWAAELAASEQTTTQATGGRWAILRVQICVTEHGPSMPVVRL
jgi:hypothetical protein